MSCMISTMCAFMTLLASLLERTKASVGKTYQAQPPPVLIERRAIDHSRKQIVRDDIRQDRLGESIGLRDRVVLLRGATHRVSQLVVPSGRRGPYCIL